MHRKIELNYHSIANDRSIVSQLELPNLQKQLRMIHEAENQIEMLESKLSVFPDLDIFLRKCLQLCDPSFDKYN